MNEINWKEQWQLHAPGFDGEFAHVALEGQTMWLQPGPGFGDCSHPTTRLMLKAMAPLVKGAHVVDIGCGSGVLSVAAALLGAEHVWALDIDPLAEEHTLANAQLNQVQDQITCTRDLILPQKPYHLVILINMISSEQERAWASIPLLHNRRAQILSSGILLSQEKAYCQHMQKQRGWMRQASWIEDAWCCFTFLM